MFQIFISFKKYIPGTEELTKEYTIAKELYDHLESIGYKDRVFLSEEKLKESGNSNFREEIDKALDEANVLIFISDNPELLNTNWVKHEWGSFSNEIFSSRKQGKIFGYVTKGVSANDLPYSLRETTLFRYKDDLDVLDTYLESSFQSDKNPFESNWNEQKRNIHIELAAFSYVRDEFSKFVDNEFYINSSNIYKAIYNNKNSLIMSMINKVKEIDTDDMNVFYLDNAFELKDIKNNLDHLKIDNPEIFIASIDKEDDLQLLFAFLREYPESQVLVGVNINNKTILNNAELMNVPTYHFLDLNYEETREFADFFTKSTGYRIPSKVLFYLMSDALEDLRTPVLLKMIFSSIIDTANYLETDYNITDIFDAIDKNIPSNVNDAILNILTLMREKKRNRILKTEIDIDIKELEKTGLFSVGNMSLSFASPLYFSYKIAELIFNENGYDVDLEDFKQLEHIIPYYAYLYYLETKELVLLEDVKDEDKDVVIDLFFSEKEAIEHLLTLDSYHSQWVPFIQKSIKSGLRLTASQTIEFIENAGLKSDASFDYLSEKYRLYAETASEALDIDYEEGNIHYYRAYVAYCQDDYVTSLKLFDKSFNKMLENGEFNYSLMLDYCELLMDLGLADRLNEIITTFEENADLSRDDIEVEKYYRIKNIIALDNLRFDEAEDYINKCIEISSKIGNNIMLNISYGDLGCLRMYQGRYEEAIKHFNINLNISCHQRNINGMAISSKMLGKVYFLKKEYETAYRYFSFAETNAQEAGNLWRLSKIRMYLKMLSQNGDLIESYDDIRKQIPSPIFLYDFELLKGSIELSKGNQKGFIHHLELAKKEADLIDNLRAKDRVYCYLGLKEPHEEISQYVNDFLEAVKGLNNDNKIKSFPLEYYRYDNIKTERLLLRRITYNDAKDIFEYTSNLANTRFVFWKRHKTLSDTYYYISQQSSVEEVGYLYTWGIILDNKLIGTIDATYNEDYQEVELGYILNIKYWHKGYAKEAAEAVISFLKKIKINKLVGVCFTVNDASKRLLEALGFKFIKKIEEYHSRPDIKDKSGLYYELEL